MKKTAGTWQIPLALEQLNDPIFCRLYPHFLLGNLPALPFCLSVCSFLYFFLRLCRRFCFCLSPPLMSKRIKKEKATGSYLLVPVSAPFCLSIDQVREKDNAILLFVCCSNKCRRVAMLGPNFVSFSLFLISLCGWSKRVCQVVPNANELSENFLLEQSNHTTSSDYSFTPVGRWPFLPDLSSVPFIQSIVAITDRRTRTI